MAGSKRGWGLIAHGIRLRPEPDVGSNRPPHHTLAPTPEAPIPPALRCSPPAHSWLPRAPPRLVLGGGADVVVDMDGLDEAAFFCGAEPAVVCPGLPHDLMLASQWERPAAQLVEWLRTV